VAKCEQKARARLMQKRAHDDEDAQRKEDQCGSWRKDNRCLEDQGET